MKQIALTFIYTLLIATLVSSCAGLKLDTPNKAYLGAESTYISLLSTAIALRDAGRISEEKRAELTVLFDKLDVHMDKANQLRVAYNVHKGTPQGTDFATQLDAELARVDNLLFFLREIVEILERD